MITFRPTDDRLVVKQLDPETKTAGGFIIPQMSEEIPNRGTVISKGPGRTTKKGVLLPIIANVGDIVMFDLGAGKNIVDGDGQEYLVLKEEEIIAIVE